MKVLVVGASGKYAGFVVPELIKRGATVRALIRERKKADEVRNRGASETAIGDLSDPESLRSAASGVDGVFHINPAQGEKQCESQLKDADALKSPPQGFVQRSSSAAGAAGPVQRRVRPGITRIRGSSAYRQRRPTTTVPTAKPPTAPPIAYAPKIIVASANPLRSGANPTPLSGRLRDGSARSRPRIIPTFHPVQTDKTNPATKATRMSDRPNPFSRRRAPSRSRASSARWVLIVSYERLNSRRPNARVERAGLPMIRNAGPGADAGGPGPPQSGWNHRTRFNAPTCKRFVE
jgi:hypothetical protein